MEILRCWINVHETTIRQNRKIQSLIYIHNAQHSCQNKFHIGSYINNTNSLQKSSKWPWFLDKIVLGFLIHCISQQYVFKIHGHIRISGFQVRVKNNNNRGGGLSEARIFFGIKISCKSRIFSICWRAYSPNPRLTSNPYIYQDILNHSFTKQKF